MKIKSLIKHNLMRAAMTLALILACAAAWAQEVQTYYIDENGTRHDVTATVLTGNESYIGTSNQTKWYVVNSNINYSDSFVCRGNVNIILADNNTMTVNSGTIIAEDLTIYGQSEQSGSLNVPTPPPSANNAIICDPGSFIINGGTVNANADGSMNAIYCFPGNFIINRGTVNATNTSTSTGSGIYAKYVTINGGNVTANGRDGIFAFGITLGWRNTTDRVYANSYSGTVKVKDGQAFKDSNGNIYVGTLNNSQINGKTLTPATQTEYIQYCLGTGNDGSAEHPYTISDANGWIAFCLALDDNTTYNHFSGKTVKLGANITVSRMAGSTGFQNYHPFCGTFDGNHKTITFNKGTANSPESGHSALFAATEATGSNDIEVVIKDLTVDGTIYTSSDCAAGFVGSSSSRLTITGCQSNITIYTSNKYAAGFVSANSGILNITDCVSSATIISSRDGDGYHGGFLGQSNRYSSNNITGCLFDGKLLTTNNTQNCGGFIGWYSAGENNSQTNVTNRIVNSLYKPAPLESGETAITSGSPFVCWNPDDTTNEPNITNSYYFDAVLNTQLLGKAAHSIAAGNQVTMTIVGTPTQYSLSGISYFDTSTQYFTLQNGCLQFANELYAGLGDEVSITLAHSDVPEGYQFDGYSPAENLSESGSNYYTHILTMPDADVVITAPVSIINYTITYHLNGGTMPAGVSNPTTYTIEDADIILNNPEREGYIFGGWYGTPNFLYGVVTTIAHGSTGNKDLYARWGSGVEYIDADGSVQHHECDELNGNETDLAEGWYVVRNTNPDGVDLTYENQLTCDGDLNLILCDGATMSLEDGLRANGTLTIYGQSEGTGTLTASSSSYYTLNTSGIIINGGIINATYTGSSESNGAISAGGSDFIINRGSVTADGKQGYAVNTAYFHFNGGNFIATNEAEYTAALCTWGDINLSWQNPTDSYYAKSYEYVYYIHIAEGKTFVDEVGNLYSDDIDVYNSDIQGKTLQPYDAPTNLTVSGITMTSATLTWEAFFAETQWQVSWSENGGSTWSIPITVNAPQYEMTGLTPGATVQVQVKGVFGENLYGHAATCSFNTHTACDAPVALSSNATSNTAILSWTGFQNDYNVRYAKTITNPVPVLSEDFEGGTMPTGWTTTNENNYWQITSGTGEEGHTGAANGSSYNAGCYIGNKYDLDILITPAMNLSNVVSATLSFNFWNTEWSGDINTLNVFYRVDGGEWNLLYSNNQATAGWIPVTVTLEGMAANYQIGFGCQANWSYGMGIDDVVVTTTSTEGNWTINNHVTSPYTINSLRDNTQYVWQVQGNTTSSCGGSTTEWIEDFFTTELSSTVSYIDENGDIQTKLLGEYMVLDETCPGTTLASGWYVVNHDVTINTNKNIECRGELNIILVDNCTFTINSSSKNGIFCIYGDNATLNIYGQTAGTGTLNIAATNTSGNGIYCDGGVNIVGGIINVSSRGGWGIFSKGPSFSGGQVYATASSNYQGIRSQNDIHLSWRNPSDRIFASKYRVGGSIIIASGKSFIDEDGNTYESGTVNASAIDGKTLYPNLEGIVMRTIEGYNPTGTGTDDLSRWVFISSPVRGSIAPDDVINIFSATDYDLYRFNQAADKEWQNWKEGENNAASGFNLENGRGYLYATKETKTLVFTSNSFNTDETMTVDLDYTDGKRLAGWNLVGNPFAVNAYINRPYYELATIDGRSAVNPTPTNNTTAIAPVTGVMVKANGTGEKVFFSKTPLQQNAINNGHLHITLAEQQVTTRGEVSSRRIDKAIVSFNEGEELGKFYFGTQNANIYIPQGQEEYAIAFSEGQGEMPLNFKAIENGEYTISVKPENVNLAYLHLIDNMTGADVDLLASDGGDARPCVSTYTFTAKTTDYESRFKLVFSICEDANGDNEAFAFISNGNIIVNGIGTLQVFDVLGHQLVTKQLSTLNSQLSTLNYKSGVYVLRLINGENVRTQKIVIE